MDPGWNSNIHLTCEVINTPLNWPGNKEQNLNPDPSQNSCQVIVNIATTTTNVSHDTKHQEVHTLFELIMLCFLQITLQPVRGYLLGRCVKAPPAGLTGVFRWRRRRLTTEGWVRVGLMTLFTFTRLFIISRVHTHPVTAGSKHAEKYIEVLQMYYRSIKYFINTLSLV